MVVGLAARCGWARRSATANRCRGDLGIADALDDLQPTRAATMHRWTWWGTPSRGLWRVTLACTQQVIFALNGRSGASSGSRRHSPVSRCRSPLAAPSSTSVATLGRSRPWTRGREQTLEQRGARVEPRRQGMLAVARPWCTSPVATVATIAHK